MHNYFIGFLIAYNKLHNYLIGFSGFLMQLIPNNKLVNKL